MPDMQDQEVKSMFLSFKRELEAELRLEKKKARQEGLQ
jgi:hypothetical protein